MSGFNEENSKRCYKCRIFFFLNLYIFIIYICVYYRISAIDAGITLFQEVGLDPGIDHLLAMNCFDEVRAEGGKVIFLT